MMQGNDVRNTTTVQIFGCGFDSVYAGNRLTHLYSTKTIHPGGLFVFALDYSGGTQPNFNFELISNTMEVSFAGNIVTAILSDTIHQTAVSERSP